MLFIALFVSHYIAFCVHKYYADVTCKIKYVATIPRNHKPCMGTLIKMQFSKTPEQKYLNSPAGPPTYCCLAFKLHISL